MTFLISGPGFGFATMRSWQGWLKPISSGQVRMDGWMN